MTTTVPPAKRRRLDNQDMIMNTDHSRQEVSGASPSKAVPKVVEVKEGCRLELGKTFAGGGYADVYKATMALDGSTDHQQVAVKVFRNHGRMASPLEREQNDMQVEKNFRREIEIWKRLSHPCITPLLAYVESSSEIVPGSGAALISPYRKNANLSIYLKKNPHADKLSLLQQVGEGLHYLHTFDPPIAHLDLKAGMYIFSWSLMANPQQILTPQENILIDDDEKAELCDFGLAKALEIARAGSATSTWHGTMPYAAPEGFNGERQTTASDIYAMGGVILYVMSGVTPWKRRNPGQIMKEVSQGGTPPMEEHSIYGCDPLAVVEAIWVLIRWCWSFNPPNRPKSWDVLDALTDLQKRRLATVDNRVAGGNSLEPPHRDDVAFGHFGAAQPSFNSRSSATMAREAPSPIIEDFLEALELRPPVQPLAQADIFLCEHASSTLGFQNGPAQRQDDLSGTTEDFLEATELQPPVQPHPAMFLNGSTCTHQLQDSLQNCAGDLVASNMCYQEPFHLRPVVQLQPNVFRDGLASTLEPQYNRGQDRDDLSAAIERYQETLDSRPPGHPSHHILLDNLARALKSRYDRGGDPADLSVAIEYHRKALDLCPPSHPSRHIFLSNLGLALQSRYDRDQELADLAAAIPHHREALDLRLPGHSSRHISLSNLACALKCRYDRDQNPVDLSVAIEHYQEALDLCPPGHPSRHISLDNLAGALGTRCRRDMDPTDLSVAIEHFREALDLRPPGHSSRHISLYNLAVALRSRYDRDQNPTDLSIAIQHFQGALDVCPPNHPRRNIILNHLGRALQNLSNSPYGACTAIAGSQEVTSGSPSHSREPYSVVNAPHWNLQSTT